MRFVALFAWARLRHRPTRWLLVAVGVAVATVLPVLAESSASIVATQAVRYGVAQLDPGQRGLIASTYGIAQSPDALQKMNDEVRRELAPLAAQPPRAELLYGRLAEGAGATYFFGAVDDLRTAVHITSGRAPTSCTPQRCEVVVLGSGTPQLSADLGLVVVGRAVRTDPLLLSGTFDPGHDVPVLLADGVTQATQLASLDQFPRTYGWVTPVDLDRVQRLGVDAYLARSARIAAELMGWGKGINLDAPDDVLRAQDARAQQSARRFALLGGSATALLLGFAAIGAIGLRREHAAVTELLRRRGAPRRAVALLTGVESAAPVLVGGLVGVLVGAAMAGWRGLAAELPYWHSAIGAVRAAGLAVAVGALAAWILVALVRSWPGATAARTAWRALDFTVLAGLAVVGLALSRGAVTASSLGSGTDPLLLALPVLFVVCGGLLVGRVWPVLVGSGAKLLPHRLLAARLGLLGALRRPLRPVATAAFFAAAAGIVVFAAGYQATLRQGAVEQATFAVPLSASVATGTTLVQPLDIAHGADYAALAPGVSAHGVLRTDAGIRLSANETLTANVLGVDPAALREIPSWTHVVGGVDAASAARSITAGSKNQGILVPAGSTRITVPVTGDLSQVTLTAWLRSADGRDRGVLLDAAGGTASGAVPANLAAPVRLFALALAQSSDYTTIQQHHLGEGGTNIQGLSGTLALGPPRFDGGGSDAVPDWSGWGSTTAEVNAANRRMTVGYKLTGNRIVIRPGTGTLAAPIPVLADPVTAAHAGNRLLPLVMNGNEPVQARVVGVVRRFPTLGTRFLVADAGALADALDAREPGTGSVTELWLAAPDSSTAALTRALATSPYDQLHVSTRDSRTRQLQADPLARGATALLSASALLALLIAALSVVLLVVAEQRDDSTELYAWESDGLPPRTLRMSLFARACAVVAVAVPGGLLVGVALSTVTTRLVTVTAVGTTPNPPLHLAIGPVWALVSLAGGIAIGLLAAAAVASAALRERLPRRPEEELW
jgi:hypothetical protein